MNRTTTSSGLPLTAREIYIRYRFRGRDVSDTESDEEDVASSQVDQSKLNASVPDCVPLSLAPFVAGSSSVGTQGKTQRAPAASISPALPNSDRYRSHVEHEALSGLTEVAARPSVVEAIGVVDTRRRQKARTRTRPRTKMVVLKAKKTNAAAVGKRKASKKTAPIVADATSPTTQPVVRYDLAELVRDHRWYTVIHNGVETRERRPSLAEELARTKAKVTRTKAPGSRTRDCTYVGQRTSVPVYNGGAEGVDATLLSAKKPTRRSLFGDPLWPSHVAHLRHQFNPHNVQFEFEEPFVASCECELPCRKDTCPNGILGVFCTPVCCDQDAACGNRLADNTSARLTFDEAAAQYAVIADSHIDEGVVIGQYVGIIVAYPRTKKGDISPNNGYRLKIKRKSTSHPRSDIFIDAERFGGITRFLNHSCCPNARFHEVRNGSVHTVVAITDKAISSGQEITVDYGPDLWFICRCGEPTCVHREIQHLQRP